MTTRRTALKLAFAGLLLRELCKAGIRLADWADPCGSAPGWTALVKPEVVCPDTVPDALLVRW